MRQTVQVLIPLILLGIAFVLATESFFESSPFAFTTIIVMIGILLCWRRWVFNSLSEDYMTRFESATASQMMGATKWTGTIYVGTYVVSILACSIAYFLRGEWTTFALIVLLIGMIAKAPWSLLATDWKLHQHSAKD